MHILSKNNKNTFLQYCLLFIMTLFNSGCATLGGPPNPDDPYESFNRSMFSFNEGADKYVIKPVAKGYDYIMPNFASKGVSNFFRNLDDIVVFFNQLLQFKLTDAAATSARFVFNTTFGLLGLIDVASEMDLPKQNEDFGQTLAVWGVPSGPYLVLPLLGPQTVRDTAGLAVDWTFFDPILQRQTLNQSLATLAIKYIDLRAGLIKASNILDETVPDKYAFVRDAWQLRREFLVYDGHPPEEFSEEELFGDEGLFNDDDELLKDDSLNDDPLHEKNIQDKTELMNIETKP
ncbi:Outer-membrane-phospholipid-binding lipoprotein MlaA [hydrothermal vent metagenome]|uniref:Outer-membrane-phospholipid-binding lipoprotein MlaA n=1 Tax=hydrothermal vent metagenome TaxID=652676 RepID=A0A3B0WHX4_9ZZZZ